MQVQITRIGSWELANTLISELASRFTTAGQVSLERFGEEMVRVVKGHMTAQDLGWIPLSPNTVTKKLKLGYGTDILIASSTYYSSITYKASSEEVNVGVPAGTREPNGAMTEMVAAVHEFGSQTAEIPARPLWRPSFEEVLEWHFKNNRPEQIVLEKLRYFRF